LGGSSLSRKSAAGIKVSEQFVYCVDNALPCYWVTHTLHKRSVSFPNLSPTVYLRRSLALEPTRSVCFGNNPTHASDGCCPEGEHGASQFNCKHANPSFLPAITTPNAARTSGLLSFYTCSFGVCLPFSSSITCKKILIRSEYRGAEEFILSTVALGETIMRLWWSETPRRSQRINRL